MDRPRPYKGDQPYIFISYSHRDTETVLPIIATLIEKGYRVWFDDGIDPGTEWDDNIAAHLQGCGCLLAFLSNNYLSSENCRDELSYARDINKDRLLVYLEDVELPEGLKMRLNRLQAIMWYRHQNTPDYAISQITSAKGIQNCRACTTESTCTPLSKQAEPPTAASSPKKRVGLIIGVAALALVTVVGIVFATGVGRRTASTELRTEEEAPVIEQAAPGSAEVETKVSQAVAADPYYTITLTADEAMNVKAFNEALDILTERLDFCVADRSYTMEITDDVISLVIPASMLHGWEATNWLRCFISRPTELFLLAAGDEAVAIPRDQIEAATVVSELPKELGVAESTAEGTILKLSLSDDMTAQLEPMLVSSNEEASAPRLVQDYVAHRSSYFYWDSLQLIENDLYICGDISDAFEAEMLAFNYSRDTLSNAFTFVVEKDLDRFGDWQDPDEAAQPGANQCAFAALNEECVTFSLCSFGEEITVGEKLDLETTLKERLDLLGQPYAFGWIDQQKVIVKTTAAGMSEDILSLLISGNSACTLSCNGIKYTGFSREFDFSYEAADNGLTLAAVPQDADACEKLNAFIDYAAQFGEAQVALHVENGFTVFSGTFDTTEAQLILDQEAGRNESGIAPESEMLLKLITCNFDSLSCYRGDYQVAPEAVKPASGEQYRAAIEQELSAKITALYPAAAVSFDNGRLSCYLHMSVDSQMTEQAIEAAKAVYNQLELQVNAVTTLAIYFVDENEDECERFRLFFVLDAGYFYGAESDYNSIPAQRCHGIIANGRLVPYQEGFQTLLESDSFFAQFGNIDITLEL